MAARPASRTDAASGLAPAAFLGRLAREAPPTVVVAAGAERWFRDRVVEALVRRAFPDGDPGGGLVRLDGRRSEDRPRIDAIVDELRGTSLFAAERLVVVDEPDAGAAPGPGKPLRSTTLVKAAMSDAPTGAQLVVSTARGLKGKSAIGVAAIAKAGAWIVDCRSLYDAPAPWERGKAPHDHELARHLVERARKAYDRRISLEVAHALTRQVGSDLALLESALDRLAPASSPGATIGLDKITTQLGRSREDPLWTLVDAVLDGDVARATDLVEQAFENGLHDERDAPIHGAASVFPLMNRALQNGVTRIHSLSEALARGEGDAEALAAAGIPSFSAEVALVRARRNPARFEALSRHLFEAELSVKTGRVPPRVAGERLVAALALGLARSHPTT